MHRYPPPTSTPTPTPAPAPAPLPSSLAASSSGLQKEAVRPDSSFSAPSLNTRRSVPLIPYNLKCDQEPLNARLGPPDYFPPTPNCAEESLSRDAFQNGYKETVDGIEESRETSYSLVKQQVWAKPLINKYKEAIRKRLTALNNSLLRKRKAGQVYGVPLSGPLLANPGHFPEQRHSGEDNRKKWIEDLSQHKRLKVLADHVPHGLRRRSLFDALVKNEVPFLRASWYIKVMYLNQVRPLSIGMSGGGADKSQQKRVELWTKEALEYMQSLLDELCQHEETQISAGGRDSGTILPTNSSSQKLNNLSHGSIDEEEPPLVKRWHYMYHVLQLHMSEGLLHRAEVIDWVLKQLQEREALDAVELLLPTVLDLIDDISTCQTLVRPVVDIFLHKLQALCPGHNLPDPAERPRENYAATFFIELLSYLITVVPDSFVALDCFPLPAYIFLSRKRVPAEVKDEKVRALLGSSVEMESYRHKKSHHAYEIGVKFMADVIQRRAISLAKAVNPGSLRKNEGSVIQCLDKALITGDVLAVYHCMFDEDFCGHEQPPDEWLSKVSPWLKLRSVSSGNVSPAEVFSVRFLCEWAICDFRDCRKISNTPIVEHRTASLKSACRVLIAVSVLCLRLKEVEEKRETNNTNGEVCGGKKTEVNGSENCKASSFFDSPGPIHDIIAAWLDQHDLRKGEGFERLQLLLWELVKKGLFWPPAYVRKLIVSGVLEKEAATDKERASRHRYLLQHLPWPPGLSMEEDGRKNLDPELTEAIRIHRNERRFCLQEFGRHHSSILKHQPVANQQQFQKTVQETSFAEKASCTIAKTRRLQKKKTKVTELKQAIAKFFRFPDWCFAVEAGSSHDKSFSLQSSLKRQSVSQETLVEKLDGTPSCNECNRNKKQRNNEGSSVFIQGHRVSPRDNADMWWIKKKPKPVDTVKTEPIGVIKPAKQPSRGRPKTVRKLSLAQLDAIRTEGSQGASSSDICDSKVSCPYHKPAIVDIVLSQNKEGKKNPLWPDLKTIIGILKCLRLSDRGAVATWLDATVRSLVEGGNKLSSVSTSMQQSARMSVTIGSTPAADDRSSIRWQLEEEDLVAVLCLLDAANDFCLLIRFLLWLLPKASISNVVSPGQNYRFSTSPALLGKEFACMISESIILTSLRRYEGVLLATNLLPEVFSAGMQRATLLLMSGSTSRISCASLFAYIRELYKKYGSLQSVQLWEKNWRPFSDQRMVNELELLKAGDSEPNFPLLGVNSPNIGEDRDDSLPPRLMGRLVRFGPHMRDHVRRGFQEVINQMITKEREIAVSGNFKDAGPGRWGEGVQAAQSVAGGLLECIKQQAGTTVSGDMQLAAAAVSAVVSNVGNAVAGVFENLASSSLYFSSASMASCLKCARQILQAHLQCLRYLKESLGEKQTKVLESALACEATAVIANVSGNSHIRAPKPQFQLSPETPDPSSTLNEVGAGSNGFLFSRSNTIAAAVGAFVVCAVLEDVVSLENIISLLKIKEGLENLQLSKINTVGANGMSRVASTGTAVKCENMAEVHLFWFRVLIGDCGTVAGGLLADVLGESNILALLRMQRLLTLATVFLPAYSLFSISLRGEQTSSIIGLNRDDTSFQQLSYAALGDLLAHNPFSEVCLQDTKALVDLLHFDTSDVEYASFLDNKGADVPTKLSCMVPSRPRLFLHAILDHKLPTVAKDELYIQIHANGKGHVTLTEELVQILDDMHPATFHWQWVEIRLLLNEQIFMDKFEAQNMSLAAEAMHAARLAIMDKQNLSDPEKNFTDMILTRLLVRPDAAGLYSEGLRLLGRAFEDYLILQVQWILENGDVVLGRKFLRQQLEEVAHRQKFKLGSGRFRVWEWVPPQPEESGSGNNKQGKPEGASPEEGEVAQEYHDFRKQSNDVPNSQNGDFVMQKQFAIEKALADLLLPCLARSSTETYSRFASRLVKQISELEQQVNIIVRSSGRPGVATSESGVSKRLGSQKGSRTGFESSSPGIGRRGVPVTDLLPPSVAALQTSLWLRLQFLLPLLPPIYTDRDQTGRNMRSLLAPVLLRLLGTRFVQESIETFCFVQHDSLPISGWDLEWNAAANAAVMAGENLFDRILSVLHALLSNTWASWLKQKPSYKANSRPPREVPPFDKEITHRMQVDLDHMHIPSMVRARIQAAMPILAPSPMPTIASGPPQVPASALPIMQLSTNCSSTLSSITTTYKVPTRLDNLIGKVKQNPVQDLDTEIDPWTLLEDVTTSSNVGSGGVLMSTESGSSKACAWLKGAVRVRRANLTYIGLVDDDS